MAAVRRDSKKGCFDVPLRGRVSDVGHFLPVRRCRALNWTVWQCWLLGGTASVRLKVRTNSGVKVPVGQSTGCLS